MNNLISTGLLDSFARSGGGGSGGDGGGFGGFAILGFFVAYALTAPFKKFLPRNIALPLTAGLVTVATLATIILAVFSASFLGWWLATEFTIGLWSGWTGKMFSIWDKMKKKFQKADEDLAKAGWNEAELQQVATQSFMRYQDDWSRRDPSRFGEYMTPHYQMHASYMVLALTELKRFNTMKDVQIMRIDTSAVYDNTDDTQDFFSVLIEAKADDSLVQEVDGKVLFNDKRPFVEEWTFQRGKDTWLLANIRQTTESQDALEIDMRQFATENNMYYSLDMGWLFIPTRGELFNNGKWMFGYSDINNHVIGSYNERLIQLYTYKRSQNQEKDKQTTYLVGQIHVPRQYGGILIERKKGLFNRVFSPKGYEKYEFEWPDFNKNYNVYATDQSRLATFELLNPGFMAFLYDTFNDVNIEVVDNIIYFYAPKTGARADYQNLMSLLTKAFKELRL